MNKVELQGRIHNIYNGNGFTTITLIVGNGTHVNFPEIVFYSEERSLLANYEKNDYVNITGCYKARKVTKDGKTFFKQFIRGYLIYPVRTQMSEKFERDLGGDYEFKNEVLLDGTIIAVNDKNGIFNFVLKPNDEKFTLRMTAYFLNKINLKHMFKVGNEVCIRGKVQTSRKEREDGKVDFYENLICDYIVIPKEEEQDN